MSTYELKDESALLARAARFGIELNYPAVVYLAGELGAGKTTFARGLIQSLGYSGNVKSPTYTLVETYNTGGKQIAHFDLYRLEDPEELHAIGYREIISTSDLVLVEWSEKGGDLIPKADYQVDIDYAAEGRLMHINKSVDLS